jgi:hypothetical protein
MGYSGWGSWECQVVRGKRDMSKAQLGLLFIENRKRRLLLAMSEAKVIWVPERRQYVHRFRDGHTENAVGLFVRVLEGADALAEEQRRTMVAYEHAEGEERARLESRMVDLDAAMEGLPRE